MKTTDEEANHWPGFVDALSTIVMVVTFLLIILAVAIFVASLTTAKVESTRQQNILASSLEQGETLYVDENLIPDLADVGSKTRLVTANKLELRFIDTTIKIDPDTVEQVKVFSRTAPMPTGDVDVISYHGIDKNPTQRRRIAYYRLMATRNVLIDAGLKPENLFVSVAIAPSEAAVDTVIVTTR